MGLKRKPPAGNVRYTIASKAQETMQCESFQERKVALLFDRDPTIQAYRSQPAHFTFVDAQGQSQTYVPDFIVWRTSGEQGNRCYPEPLG